MVKSCGLLRLQALMERSGKLAGRDSWLADIFGRAEVTSG